jgi:hypothetical protein
MAKRTFGVLNAFNELVRQGCDRGTLLKRFRYVRLAKSRSKLHTIWDEYIGFRSPKDLRSAIKRIESACRDFERMSRSAMGVILLRQGFRVDTSAIRSYSKRFTNLPVTARMKMGLAFARWGLVEYVLKATGAPHDSEVAELICAAERNPRYSETTHRQWRDVDFPRRFELIAGESLESWMSRRRGMSDIPEPPRA